LHNELLLLSNNPLLVEDLILSFDKQANFPNLFLPLRFVIKKAILRKLTDELLSFCVDVQ
jgi:hypothetical protein